MPLIEMLAASGDISEYVNRQTYREAVQSQVKSGVEKIKTIQDQLMIQKATVEKIITIQ